MNLTFVAVFLNHLASSCQEAGRERTHRMSVSSRLQFFSLKSSRTRSLRYLIIAEITSTASISFPFIAFTFVDLKNGSYNKHRYIYAWVRCMLVSYLLCFCLLIHVNIRKLRLSDLIWYIFTYTLQSKTR